MEHYVRDIWRPRIKTNMGGVETLHHFPFLWIALIRQNSESHLWGSTIILYINFLKEFLSIV